MAISSPTNNAAVKLGTGKTVAVNYNTNYTLKAPGTCGGAENCGHLYLLIDSTSCNQASLPYNTLGFSSPIDADLSKCAAPLGQHTITLELHHDDGTAVLNLLNNPVTAQVIITAEQ